MTASTGARAGFVSSGTSAGTGRTLERGPIFLAGIDRSGLGFLCELLELHPAIAMTHRTNFWSYYFNRFGDLRHRGNLERCLAGMVHCRRMRVFKPDPEELHRALWATEPTYTRLFALLQEGRARRLGKARWGDKSMDSEEYADTILTAYPGAKMIHVIRDPRDRYASVLTHRIVGKGGIGAGTAHWLRSVWLAKRNLLKFPERYTVLRYETLVARPEATLRQVCDFLGEEYSPAMLMTNAPRAWGAQRVNPEEGPSPRQISTARVGRFRDILSEREVAFIQLCAGKEMAEYGYQPETVHQPLSSRLLFYFADFPINAALMLGWRAHSAALKRIGRAPSARRLIPEREPANPEV